MRGPSGHHGSKSSHSKPPHLPHPRSRSLDTALDKASDDPPTVDKSAPQCGSVAGSLTDSTMPDSVATDSVTDIMAASDTDASDSGIFNRYNYSKSNNKTESIKRSNSKSGLKSKLVSSEKEAQGSKIRSRETENNNWSQNSKISSKNPKQNFTAPSGKDRNKKNTKGSDSFPKPGGTAAKIKALPLDVADKTLSNSKKTFDALKISEKPTVELDPYNDFYNRKISPKVKDSNNKPLSSLNLKLVANKEVPVTGSSPKRNPYVSPLIMSFKNNKSPSTTSVLIPKISNTVMLSPVKSPFSPRSSRSSSLPYSGSESMFKFPSPEPSSSERESSTTPVASEEPPSPFQSSTRPSFSPIKYRNSPLREKEPSPSRLFPGSNSTFRKKMEDACPTEGSHADLVASCEQYLKKEGNASDLCSTLSSSRRYSLDSSEKATSGLRRRLSSIPTLDDDFNENDGEVWKRSRKSSDTSHEMAIFSAIAALSQVGDFSKADGEDTFSNENNAKDSVNDNANNIGRDKILKRMGDNNKGVVASKKPSQETIQPPTEGAGAPSSSLLDKCVSRVKTFIKK